MAQREHFSLRLPSQVLRRLEEQAAARGATKTALAEAYLAEAITVADHPGIVFRDGTAGRRASVVGGPDVWEVVETFHAEGRDVAATARYLRLPPGVVQAVIGYYVDHRDEIDGWVARNAAEADRAEEAARRVQALRG